MKKLNQQGIGHHLVIAGLAVLVLGVAAFAGWRVYQGRQIDASASSIPVIFTKRGTYYGDVTLRACRLGGSNVKASANVVHSGKQPSMKFMFSKTASGALIQVGSLGNELVFTAYSNTRITLGTATGVNGSSSNLGESVGTTINVSDIPSCNTQAAK